MNVEWCHIRSTKKKNMAPINFLVLLISTILVFAVASTVTSTSTGFSLRLFYTNTTGSDLARNSSLRSHVATIRPRLQYVDSNPYVEVGFGTPTPQKQILHVDTASDLTWFPCKPSIGIIPPGYPPFDQSHSHTYQTLQYVDPVCRQPWTENHSGVCYFKCVYLDGTETRGVMARDTLSSPSSDHGSVVRHDNFVFGCSHHVHLRTKAPLSLSSSGILGMGRGALSLQYQIQQPKFSHCFSTINGAVTYLRFGSDTDRRGNTLPLKSIPFRSNNLPDDSPFLYYLNAVDISVNNQRLNLRPVMFANRPFMIDSGSTYSWLYRDAHVAVKGKLVEHFARFGIRLSSDLCFTNVPGRRFELPTIDIHFSTGDDYRILPENLFKTSNNVYCLMIKSSDTDSSTLGFYQQRNMRIIYDLTARPNGALRFAQEDCSRDPAV